MTATVEQSTENVNPQRTKHAGGRPRKYNTEEERKEAARKSRQEYYLRNKEYYNQKNIRYCAKLKAQKLALKNGTKQEVIG